VFDKKNKQTKQTKNTKKKTKTKQKTNNIFGKKLLRACVYCYTKTEFK
jgi:hypothetical protein